MRIKIWSPLLLLVVVVSALHVDAVVKTSSEIAKQWTHVNVIRSVDLSSNVVREVVSVVAQNQGKEPAADYYFTVKAEDADRISHLVAVDKKNKADLDVEPTATDPEK